MKEGEVELITAHMLINVVTAVDLFFIFKELTRVAKNGGIIVVNDYNPLSSYRSERVYLVEELFRLENAVSYLANGEPTLVWYPSEYVTNLLKLLAGKSKLMYDKTPWEKDLLKEHLEVIEEKCLKISDENLKKFTASSARNS